MVGDLYFIRLSQSSVNEVTNEVAAIMAPRIGEFVRMPDQAEQEIISRKFYHLMGSPNCIGAIDGCHVPIYKVCSELIFL